MDEYELQWTVTVKESYRAIIRKDELPMGVTVALSQGFTLDEIASGYVQRDLTEKAFEILQEAHDALGDYSADHEEGPRNEEVTDRDMVTFTPVVKWVRRKNDPGPRTDAMHVLDEHSPLL